MFWKFSFKHSSTTPSYFLPPRCTNICMGAFYLSFKKNKSIVSAFWVQSVSPCDYLFLPTRGRSPAHQKITLFSVLHGVDAVFLKDGDVRVVFMPCRDCAHHSTGPENFLPFPLDGPSLLQGSALDFPDLHVEAQEETALLGVGSFLGASCCPSQQNLGCFWEATLHVHRRGQNQQQNGQRAAGAAWVQSWGHGGSFHGEWACLHVYLAGSDQAGLSGVFPQPQHPQQISAALLPLLQGHSVDSCLRSGFNTKKVVSQRLRGKMRSYYWCFN